jgi:hypothetical protein
MSAEQTFTEGQSLLDQLSLPVKDAWGKDITPPDYPKCSQQVDATTAGLQERKLRTDELVDVRRLRLQQILQLRTCERDAEQVSTHAHNVLCTYCMLSDSQYQSVLAPVLTTYCSTL